MKKYVFKINDSEIKKYGVIRHSNDILLYYINVAKLYINGVSFENGKPDKFVEIIISNYSRVFMKFDDNKIISFLFPFTIKENERELFFNGIRIDAKLLAYFEYFLRCTIANSTSFFNNVFNEKMYEEMKDVNVEDLIDLYSYLISFDSGYFRVEHDEKNNKNNHPVDHIDLYYSQKCTFKMGYMQYPEINYIQDMVDNEKNRKYVSI